MKNRMSVILVNFVHDSYLYDLATMLQSDSDSTIIQAGYANLLPEDRQVNINFSQVDNPKKIEKNLLKMKPFFYNSDYEKQERTYLGMFLTLLNRTTLGIFDANICNFYFRFLLNFFREEIIKINPSLIVFDSTPHMPAEFCLFIAAKQLGIKTIYPSRVHLGPRVIFMENLPYFEAIPKHNVVSGADENFPTKSPWLRRSVEQNKSSNNSTENVFSKNVLIRIRAKISITISYARKSFKIISTSRWRSHYFHLDRVQSARILFLNFYRYRRQLRFLHQKAKFRVSETLPKEYCCFMLQYQPERSTMPEAFEFSDQISALLYLRSVLPEKMPILVKEHPKQLQLNPGNPRPLQFRSELFYKTIVSIDNVFLVEPNFDSLRIIAEAKLVSSATGSAILEALDIGVPCLSFARNWLSDFEFAPFVLDVSTTALDVARLMNVNRETIKLEFEKYKREHLNFSIMTLDSERVTSFYSAQEIQLFQRNFVDYIKLALSSN